MGYTWERNEQVEWWENGEFETIEECIADARINHEIKIGDTIAVGTVERYEINVDADDILEALEQNAYDQCGEYAESWSPTGICQEDKGQLSEDITKIVREWLEKHNDTPGFFTISGTQTVTVH